MSIIAQTLKAKGLDFSVVQKGYNERDGWKGFSFVVSIGSVSVDYKMGIAHKDKIPTPDDVIPCLFSDASYGKLSFADFCSELGCEPKDPETGRPNRASLKVWNACGEQHSKLSKLNFTKAEKADIMAYIEEEGL